MLQNSCRKIICFYPNNQRKKLTCNLYIGLCGSTTLVTFCYLFNFSYKIHSPLLVKTFTSPTFSFVPGLTVLGHRGGGRSPADAGGPLRRSRTTPRSGPWMGFPCLAPPLVSPSWWRQCPTGPRPRDLSSTGRQSLQRSPRKWGFFRVLLSPEAGLIGTFAVPLVLFVLTHWPFLFTHTGTATKGFYTFKISI